MVSFLMCLEKTVIFWGGGKENSIIEKKIVVKKTIYLAIKIKRSVLYMSSAYVFLFIREIHLKVKTSGLVHYDPVIARPLLQFSIIFPNCCFR